MSARAALARTRRRFAAPALLAAGLLAATLPGQDEGAARILAAERAYRLGEFARAQELYAAALPLAGDRSGAVWFDMGNCALHAGAPARAVLFYRRAAAALWDEPAVAHNLGVAARQLGLAAADVATLHRRGAAPTLLWLAATLQALGLAGLGLARGRGARAVALGVLALGLGAAVVAVQQQWAAPDAEVVALRPAALRTAPDAAAAAVAELPAGLPARIVARADAWLEVAVAARRGWVAAADVERVD